MTSCPATCSIFRCLCQTAARLARTHMLLGLGSAGFALVGLEMAASSGAGSATAGGLAD